MGSKAFASLLGLPGVLEEVDQRLLERDPGQLHDEPAGGVLDVDLQGRAAAPQPHGLLDHGAEGPPLDVPPPPGRQPPINRRSTMEVHRSSCPRTTSTSRMVSGSRWRRFTLRIRRAMVDRGVFSSWAAPAARVPMERSRSVAGGAIPGLEELLLPAAQGPRDPDDEHGHGQARDAEGQPLPQAHEGGRGQGVVLVVQRQVHHEQRRVAGEHHRREGPRPDGGQHHGPHGHVDQVQGGERVVRPSPEAEERRQGEDIEEQVGEHRPGGRLPHLLGVPQGPGVRQHQRHHDRQPQADGLGAVQHLEHEGEGDGLGEQRTTPPPQPNQPQQPQAAFVGDREPPWVG